MSLEQQLNELLTITVEFRQLADTLVQKVDETCTAMENAVEDKHLKQIAEAVYANINYVEEVLF